MIELLILILLLGSFGYLIYTIKKEDEEEKKEEGEEEFNLNMILFISLIILSTSFVLGILFSNKFIDFLMGFSKLSSIGILLNKIKSFFIDKSDESVEDIVIKQNGGGGDIIQNNIKQNNIYEDVYDDLPYESDDEF